MKTIVLRFAIVLSMLFGMASLAPAFSQEAKVDTTSVAGDDKAAASAQDDSAAVAPAVDNAASAASADDDIEAVESPGFHKMLKTKFIEGDASFMSLVALALVIGLAFCIERVIYLTLSEIDTDKFMAALDGKIASGDIEGAKTLCRPLNVAHRLVGTHQALVAYRRHRTASVAAQRLCAFNVARRNLPVERRHKLVGVYLRQREVDDAL